MSSIHVRYLNAARNTLAKVLAKELRLFGVSHLEIADFSYGAIETTSPDFFRTFTNLRFLNLSHNAIGSDLRNMFSFLHVLEVLDLSNNKISRISRETFVESTRLKRLHLADNELTQIDINLRHFLVLEYIDLSGNRLVSLSEIFMKDLDRLSLSRPLEVNVQREMFECNCESVPFLRWRRVTDVRLSDKDQLTCSYGDRDNVRMTEIDVDH